jgi:hypothetical protein
MELERAMASEANPGWDNAEDVEASEAALGWNNAEAALGWEAERDEAEALVVEFELGTTSGLLQAVVHIQPDCQSPCDGTLQACSTTSITPLECSPGALS